MEVGFVPPGYRSDIPSRDRRGAISAEVYHDEEIKNFSRKVKIQLFFKEFHGNFRSSQKIIKQCRHYKEYSKISNYWNHVTKERFTLFFHYGISHTHESYCMEMLINIKTSKRSKKSHFWCHGRTKLFERRRHYQTRGSWKLFLCYW